MIIIVMIVLIFNYNFEFSFSILNSLINANDLSLKLIIIDLWDRKVNKHIFDLIFQIMIEDVISDYFKVIESDKLDFKVIDEN
jgi:hypothetical protein